ncbi:MAG TPA: hypothetical protein VFA79_00405 [Myxococcales bacterium]|nr:hypothetical protein [Myxococcales bacterium]
MKRALVFAVMAAWACGPIDQSGGSGAGGAPDGGAAADGGVAVDGGAGGGGGGSPDGGGSAALDCTGVVPGDLGNAVTVTTPHGGGDLCYNATADLSGNVAAEAHPGSQGDAWTGTWQIWSATGSPRGTFAGVGGDVYGQQEGFQSTQGSALVAWSATGQAARRSPLDDKCAYEAFFSAPGGTLVLERCGTKLKAYRFDAQGAPGASAEIGDAAAAAGIVDFQNRALIAVSQGGAYAARWYDANLKPAAAPFTLPGSGGSKPVVRPLLGGGAAIQIDGAWVAVTQSGAGSAEPAPQWLASHPNFDLQFIRQARAYALIPRSGAPARDTLDLYSGAGERCGSVKFPVDGLSMGPDGTVIGSSGDAGCTHAFWSGLLR